MFHFHELEQLVGELVAELLALVRDDLYWNSKTTDPMRKNGVGDGLGFLVGQGNQLDVFCAGISHTQNVFFVSSRRDQGSEQICMNSLIRLSADWQRCQQVWFRMNIRSGFLTFVTSLDEVRDCRIHIRPPIVLL
jgi:hypothetical protein